MKIKPTEASGYVHNLTNKVTVGLTFTFHRLAGHKYLAGPQFFPTGLVLSALLIDSRSGDWSAASQIDEFSNLIEKRLFYQLVRAIHQDCW